jgi:hypothetical protein
VPGIYLCLEDFKQNQPIEIFQIISNYDKEEAGFLRKVVSDGKIKFLTNNLDTISVSRKELWGYSEGSNIFLLYGSAGKKNPKVSLADQTKVSDTVTQSADYNSGLMAAKVDPGFFKINGTRLILIGQISLFTFTTAFYYNSPNPQPMKVRGDTKVKEGMLIYRTGELLRLNGYNVKRVLSNDRDLYEQYTKSIKPSKNRMRLFIIKYNQKNPIYFPVK